MSLEQVKCTSCNGTGTELNQGQPLAGHQTNAGANQVHCSRCYGSGKISVVSGNKVSAQDTTYRFLILVFTGLCIWGAVEICNYFDVKNRNEIAFFVALAALPIGVLIKDILLGALHLIILLAIVVAIGSFGYRYAHKQLTKEPPPSGCAICQDILKHGDELTPEIMKSSFGLTPKDGRERFEAVCGSIAEYCEKRHSVRW